MLGIWKLSSRVLQLSDRPRREEVPFMAGRLIASDLRRFLLFNSTSPRWPTPGPDGAADAQLGLVLAAQWGRQRRRALEFADLALSADRFRPQDPPPSALRCEIPAP